MDAARLAIQLADVCTYEGATPDRIEQLAPLLLELPVTQHAHEVLFRREQGQLPTAAREVLECVVQPGGAARFDHRQSRLVSAYLGIDNTIGSLTMRLDELGNDPHYRYNSSPAARVKERRKHMRRLAVALIALRTYPCVPRTDEAEKIRMIAALWNAAFPPLSGGRDQSNRDRLLDLFSRELANAGRALEIADHADDVVAQFAALVEAVADGPYRLTLLTGSDRARHRLIDPDVLARMFTARRESLSVPRQKIERTLAVIATIMLRVEQANGWRFLLTDDNLDSAESGVQLSILGAVDVEKLPDWLKEAVHWTFLDENQGNDRGESADGGDSEPGAPNQ